MKHAVVITLAMTSMIAVAQVGHAPSSVAPEGGDAAAGEAAKVAAQDFGARLRAALMAKMKAGGPLEAIDFCRVEAPAIAERVMAEHGVRLGRVAVAGRARNPLNAPRGWQAEALGRFEDAVAGGAAADEQIEIRREGLPEGVAVKWVRGISVEAPCLACHGRDVAPAVREAIRRHYPRDRATGFAVGDLRGALWVEVPAAIPSALDSSRARR